MRGKLVCRKHGGKAGRRPKTGLYAFDISRVGGEIEEAYQRHLANPDYTSLKQELALARAYLEEYLSLHSPSAAHDPPPLTSEFFSTFLSFAARLSRLAKSQAEIEWGPQHLITATQAMTFYQAVLEGVRRHVTDIGERERVFEYVESTLGLASIDKGRKLALPAPRPTEEREEEVDG